MKLNEFAEKAVKKKTRRTIKRYPRGKNTKQTTIGPEFLFFIEKIIIILHIYVYVSD